MITRRQLLDLHDKYTLLLALHRQEPARTAARRQAMVEVAARFPGSLREWQALPEPELAQRRDQLAHWLDAATLPESFPPWVAYSLDLHAWLRLILRLRQLPRDLPESDRLAAAHRICDELDAPWLHPAITPELLAHVDHPARGQLTQIAYVQVAARHRVPIPAVKAALFQPTSVPADR